MAANDVIPPVFTREDFRLRLDAPAPADVETPAPAIATPPLLRPISWSAQKAAQSSESPPIVADVPEVFDLPEVLDVPDRNALMPELPTIVEAEYRSDLTPAIGLLASLSPATRLTPVPEPLPVIVEAAVVHVSAPPIVERPQLATGAVYAPRQPPPARPAAVQEAMKFGAPPKRKRHLGRRLMSMLMALAMIGGGVYAVKRFVLDVSNWDPEVELFATEIAQIRGLSFRDPVVVTVLPIREYAELFTDSILGLGIIDRGMLAGELRAVGLLNGQLDTEAIGATAAVDAPAFYDGATKTVYVVSGLPDELHRFAVERALTTALLDQHLDWVARSALATPTEALAIRAAVDADAISVAREAIATPEAADIVVRQMASLAAESVTQPTPSVWASSIMGRPGLPLQPTLGALSPRQRTAQFDLISTNDAITYDLGRPQTAPSPATPSPATPSPATVNESTRGMMYWYHALASRIGPSAAWAAATVWNGDTTTVSQTATSICVESTVTALDAGSVVWLFAAFQQWAAAAVPESATEVATDGAISVTVKACDPGPTLPTGDMSAVLPFGGSAVENTIVALGRAGTTNLPERAQVCLVQWARARGGDLANPGDSPTIVEPSTGWRSPYVAAHTPTVAEIDACRA